MKPLWIVIAMVVAAGLLLRSCPTPTGFEHETAVQIAAALQSYHKAQGRFPQRVEELIPKHLPALPVMKHWLVYAAEADGSQCWIVDQVVLDSMSQYDCQQGSWSVMDVSRSAYQHPNRQVLTSPAKGA